MKQSNYTLTSKSIGYAILILVFIGTVLTGCKKEENSLIFPDYVDQSGDDDDDTNNNSGDDISGLFEQYASQVQSFTVNCDQFQIITGSENTRIYLWPGTLVDQNNQTVTGNVDIQLKEIYKKSDMILNNKTTLSSAGVLISGGEIFFKAYQNNQELKFKNGMSAHVLMPTNNFDNSMETFVGDESNEDQIMWVNTNNTMPMTYCNDSSNISFDNYCFDLDSMGYINCDKWMNDQNPQTTVRVRVPNSYNKDNCKIFVIVVNDKAVTCLNEFNNGAFETGLWYTLPETLEVVFAAIGKLNGQYYSAFVPSTIVTAHDEDLTNAFSQTTIQQFETAIKAYDN